MQIVVVRIFIIVIFSLFIKHNSLQNCSIVPRLPETSLFLQYTNRAEFHTPRRICTGAFHTIHEPQESDIEHLALRFGRHHVRLAKNKQRVIDLSAILITRKLHISDGYEVERRYNIKVGKIHSSIKYGKFLRAPPSISQLG